MTDKKIEQEIKTDEITPFTSIVNGTIKDRIKSLFKGRSMRTVAEEWGLPFSTLIGYTSRDSIPSVNNAFLIANREGVSLEWLVTGQDIDRAIKNTSSLDSNKLLQAMIERIDEETTELLLNQIERKGIQNLIVPERIERLITLVSDLSDVDLKEILIFAAKHQYCTLAGLKFDSVNNQSTKVHNKKAD